MSEETRFDVALKKLQVRLVDAANGYDEGVDLTESAHMKKLFQDLSAAHYKDAATLSDLLLKRGQTPDPDGSWFTLVHETIMNVRALVTGLKEDTLAPIADGERWLDKLYNQALEAATPADTEVGVLRAQREGILKNIAMLETEAQAARTS